MTWVKLDDGFGEHPKVLGLSDAAFRLHGLAICYAARNLTDGVIPRVWLKGAKNRAVPEAVAQLVAAGLWTATGENYTIHDHLASQSRRSGLARLLTVLRERWGAACVYCGISDGPLEVEHIIPRSRGGSDKLQNLTVACHNCNQRKRTKTAAEFGYPHIEQRAKEFSE